MEKDYDYINPAHYKQGSIEVIDMMTRIWGPLATALHCEMTAFKYRMRVGLKPDQPVERDLEKARWYEAKAKELRGPQSIAIPDSKEERAIAEEKSKEDF